MKQALQLSNKDGVFFVEIELAELRFIMMKCRAKSILDEAKGQVKRAMKASLGGPADVFYQISF